MQNPFQLDPETFEQYVKRVPALGDETKRLKAVEEVEKQRLTDAEKVEKQRHGGETVV